MACPIIAHFNHQYVVIYWSVAICIRSSSSSLSSHAPLVQGNLTNTFQIQTNVCYEEATVIWRRHYNHSLLLKVSLVLLKTLRMIYLSEVKQINQKCFEYVAT